MLRYIFIKFSAPMCSCYEEDARQGFTCVEGGLQFDCTNCGVKLFVPRAECNLKIKSDIPRLKKPKVKACKIVQLRPEYEVSLDDLEEIK